MKQKNVLLLATSLLLCSACEKELFKDPEYVIDSNFMMQQPYEVPLQTGKVAIVTMGEDTLAVTDVALTIQIPLGATVTRAESGDVKVTYVEYAALPEFKAGSYIAMSVGTFLFEDSRKADYDYNDVILHVKALADGSVGGKRRCILKVRGVALGSAKVIGFGFTDLNGVDYDLSENVRRDFFGGRGGFINTEKGQPFVAGITSSESLADQYVNTSPVSYTIIHSRKEKRETAEDLRMTTGYLQYDPIVTTNPSVGNVENSQALRYYIKVEGEKFYVGEYNKNLEGSLPYGIRVAETQNYYPLEKMHISVAFPKFTDWVKTGANNSWNSKAETSIADCYALDSSGMWRF